MVVGSSVAAGDFSGGLLQFVSYILGMGSVMLMLTLGIAVVKEGCCRRHPAQDIALCAENIRHCCFCSPEGTLSTTGFRADCFCENFPLQEVSEKVAKFRNERI